MASSSGCSFFGAEWACLVGGFTTSSSLESVSFDFKASNFVLVLGAAPWRSVTELDSGATAAGSGSGSGSGAENYIVFVRLSHELNQLTLCGLCSFFLFFELFAFGVAFPFGLQG